MKSRLKSLLLILILITIISTKDEPKSEPLTKQTTNPETPQKIPPPSNSQLPSNNPKSSQSNIEEQKKNPINKDKKKTKDKKKKKIQTTTNICRVSDCILCKNSVTSRCLKCDRDFILRKFKARYGKRNRYDICSSKETYGIYFMIVIFPSLIIFGIYLYCSLSDPLFEHMLKEKEMELKKKEEYQTQLVSMKKKGELNSFFMPDNEEQLKLIEEEEEDSLFGQGISFDQENESKSEKLSNFTQNGIEEQEDSIESEEEEEKELGKEEIDALERLRKLHYGK